MAGMPRLSLAEWTVLALLDEGPSHGFAIAGITAVGGEVGRIWQIPRPVIYRSLTRLAQYHLIEADGVEPGHGPQRTRYVVTPAGSDAVREWLASPVQHIRDVRSHLLVKLALLHRRDIDFQPLLARQRAALEPIASGLSTDEPEPTGFDTVLLAWRRATTNATMAFLDDLTTEHSGASHGH
jgi:DNA-binding PadR family transcriptional regulator